MNNNKEELNRHDISIEKWVHDFNQWDNMINKEWVKIADFNVTAEAIDKRLTYWQNSAEDIDRKLISTDNYIEKYLPIKIHKFIVSAWRNVFDNKKDIKKLKDYEAKRDLLLNEAIRNDNGIPGDFKKENPMI